MTQVYINGVLTDITPAQLATHVASLPPAAEPGPPNLEPDQFWAIVKGTGHEQALRDWAVSIEDPMERGVVEAKLEFAKFFERNHPLIEQARQAMGISAEELDGLWRKASTL